MKKIILAIFLIVCTTIGAQAQGKISFGGNLGMQFGDNTSVNIAPQVGFNLNKYFTLGLGVGYTYNKDKYYSNYDRFDYKRHYASANVFARVYPIKYIVLNIQPEGNYMWSNVSARSSRNGYSKDKFVPSVLVGGGLRIFGLLAMIQYDVVQDRYSPYSDKIIYTVGYSFDF